MAVLISTFAGGKPKYGKPSGSARQPCTGVHYHDVSIELPTTAIDGTDSILLYKFPDDHDVYLLRDATNDLRVKVDGLDSGAGLKWDFGIATSSDGVIDTVLINDSTVGQAAGTDLLDATGLPLKVDGNYFVMTLVTAAATAVEGTVQLFFKAGYGLKADIDSSLV